MKRLPLFALAVILGVPAVAGAHMGYQQLIGNFHTVLPGEVYRSSQPDAQDLADYARTYGIRSVLNLRDEEPDAEMTGAREAAGELGIRQVDFPMSSAHAVPVERLSELAEIMRDMPKPILIHCDHGSNRTSLASAVYVGAVEGGSELYADFQISPYFGHVPIEGIGRYQMSRSWEAFEETIGF